MGTRGQQVRAGQVARPWGITPMRELEPGTGCVQGTDNWDLNYWDRIGKLERPLMTSLIFQASLGNSTKGADSMSGDSQAEQSSQSAKCPPQELLEFEAERHKASHWLYVSSLYSAKVCSTACVRDRLHTPHRPAESLSEMGVALLPLQPSFFSQSCAFVFNSSWLPLSIPGCCDLPPQMVSSSPSQGCYAEPAYRHGFKNVSLCHAG